MYRNTKRNYENMPRGKKVNGMNQEDYAVSRYDGAVSFLPNAMREKARRLEREKRAVAEEIRFRSGYPPTLILPDGDLAFSEESVTGHDIESVIERATLGSAYSVRDSMKDGYITARGGYRIGIGGSMSCDGGKVGFRVITSLAIRISRQILGVSSGVFNRILQNGVFSSSLIISPPGLGKTTLLRDMIRVLSDKLECRVSLADERGEIAAISGGVPSMNVGSRTDVIDGCPKNEAVMMLLRSMNPQVIALDEITAPQDIYAIESAANCGVKLLATAHAESVDDLLERSMYRKLMELRIFKKAVIISKKNGAREYAVSDMEEYI